MPNNACHKQHLNIELLRITLPKLRVKFQPYRLKIFRVKVEKVKNA